MNGTMNYSPAPLGAELLTDRPANGRRTVPEAAPLLVTILLHPMTTQIRRSKLGDEELKISVILKRFGSANGNRTRV